MNENDEFSGVYYFTNPTKTVRKFLWNNKDYSFDSESRSPIIIPSETLENIQEIRKRWAYKLALERLYEGEPVKDREGNTIFEYKKAKETGNGLPPTFDDKILEPFIEECLKPLAIKRATVSTGKKLDDERNYKATKAVGEGMGDKALAQVFSEDPIPVLGLMPDR